MERVLLTGASGFIGGHLLNALLKQQPPPQIHILVRDANSFSQTQPSHPTNLHIHQGDITNHALIESLLASIKPTHIFHLASLISYDPQHRPALQCINVHALENILLHLPPSCKLLYCSSMAAVGGSHSPNILSESSTFPKLLHNLDLGYFATKRQAEALCLRFAHQQGKHVVIVCPTTVYGAGDCLKASRRTQERVARGKFPFYGAGGVNVVHVEDVVRGMLLAMQKGRSGHRYILGGENVTLRELFIGLAKAGGHDDVCWVYFPAFVTRMLGWLGVLPREKAAVADMYFWYSSDKACEELGYTFQPYESALRDSVRFMLERDESIQDE